MNNPSPNLRELARGREEDRASFEAAGLTQERQPVLSSVATHRRKTEISKDSPADDTTNSNIVQQLVQTLTAATKREYQVLRARGEWNQAEGHLNTRAV